MNFKEALPNKLLEKLGRGTNNENINIDDRK